MPSNSSSKASETYYDDLEKDSAVHPLVEHARSLPARLRRSGLLRAKILAATSIGLLLLLYVFSSTLSTPPPTNSTSSSPLSSELPSSAEYNISTPLHVLVPSSRSDANLCKTLLTLSVLGYPTPILLAWNETYDNPWLAGGGSMIPAKIYRVSEYLDALPASADNDLVLLIDAYDIWFQLGPSVLVSRYHALNVAANTRLRTQLGPAYDKENIRQQIVWGQQKLAEPNEAHTIAWYPIPESPLPADTYGANTDTPVGRSRAASFRPRYLNSGYAVGTVASMRALWTRSKEWYEAHKEHDDNDNGSGVSNYMYYGADNPIFNEIWGEQEYAREVARLKHLPWLDRLLHRASTKPRGGSISGVRFDNILDPAFTHQKWSPKEGKSYEFGIGIDYASDLGHQTEESVADARWLVHNGSLIEQINERNAFDCKMRLPEALPRDIIAQGPPCSMTSPKADDGLCTKNIGHAAPLPTWTSVELYTHLCYGTVPVMLHYDGYTNKHFREDWWNRLWMASHGRALLGIARARAAASAQEGRRIKTYKEFIEAPRWSGNGEIGAWTDKKSFVKWDELCPAKWDSKVFGKEDEMALQ